MGEGIRVSECVWYSVSVHGVCKGLGWLWQCRSSVDVGDDVVVV